MKLLVDVGNSRLKWGIADLSGLVSTGVLPNNSICFKALVAAWQDQVCPRVIGISSVNAPELVELICQVLATLWPGCPVLMAKATAFQCGVHNAYRQPEKLGVDRWLALIAAYNVYRQAACVVDCGTAITVDFIDAQGQHKGGLICPGLMLMKHALARGTHQLAFSGSEHRQAAGLADNTEAGIYNGTLWAACGLIEHVMTQNTGTMALLLTGGDASRVASQLACESTVDEHLVLRGLICALDEQAVEAQRIAN